jgi:carbon-monoxide dehydrogenase catalytic subunit
MTGFSNEHPHGPWQHADPDLDAVKAGKVRGIVGVVGCSNPKIKQDSANVTLIRN